MTRWEDSLKERLAASPEYAAEYLNAVLEENDPQALRLALRYVAKAQGTETPLTIDKAEGSAELPDGGARCVGNAVADCA
jgi:hypothetical protein